MEKDYEINEKDIDSTLRYLKIFDPENATPENAIAFLEDYQAAYHVLGHAKPEVLEKMYQEFKAKKRPKK